MKGFLYLISCSLVIGLMGLPAANAQNNQPPTWNNDIGRGSWSIGLEPEDEKRMLSLWDSIGEDLKNETNDLAGTYIAKGDSGYLLRWSVNKGFVVIPFFDQNLITDYGYGTVTFADNSEVNFAPEKQLKGGRGLGKMPLQWTAIWGHFVPVDSLGEFGKFRAGLGDYNDFNGACCDYDAGFLHRVDRLDRPFPVGVPSKYQRFIMKPVIGQITSVGQKQRVLNRGFSGKNYYTLAEKAVLIPVSVSAGGVHGVKRRMLFRIVGEPESTGRYLQITKVGPRNSQGVVVLMLSAHGKEDTYQDDETHQEKPLPAIRVGSRVTTSPVID